MTVESVGANDTLNYVDTKNSTSEKGLSADTETFLKLLVAQLEYQDPLNPQTDTQFVTQLAQMTSLEQMREISSTLEGSQAYDMIGKYVYAEVIDSKSGTINAYLGRVDSVAVQNGETYVVVGNNAIPVSDVKQVYDESYVEENS